MVEYLDIGYEYGSNDLVAEYYAEPAKGLTLEKAAEHLAKESSIGTWTDISTMNERIATKLKPHIFEVDKKKNIVKIAYPSELFENGNMAQVYSAIAGNIFGMNAVKNLRLEDIDFPIKMIKGFKGPKFGIRGVRKLLKVKDRPLAGTIVKPKVGLNPSQHAKVAYNAWVGGLDIVKDDENLTSMKFNKFEERIIKTLELRDRAESETGERKMYMPNVTAETQTMLKRAEFVKEHGGEYVMIDILTAGWSGLQSLREADLGLVIHAHRAMHGALTRNERHGISMIALAKTARIIGVDQIHIGTAVGKMHGGTGEVKMLEIEVEEKFVPENDNQHILEQEYANLKPVFAVASGGLHPGLTAPLMDILGKNVIMQYGGGCHGHPEGTRAGAVAIRQSIDAKIKGIDVKTYARTHKELAFALKKWGYKK
ncbi:MAG: type III ribulose-bisphosphate carboxylase [Candidatus Micrarchaeota archaeon]|nr:type III ribulose-bisphosphate carboxylase [Candidatus Micrarchaeota archaeon]